MSRYPFYDYFSDIIEDLYLASKNHMVNILEAYINKLVLECPAPPRGLVKVKLERYNRPGKFLELTQPPINELPYVNESFFDTLFRNLTVENVVQIFTHLLVERPVIIVGTSVEMMLPIITALSNLIHPFELLVCLPLLKPDPEIDVEDSTLMIV
jgi:DENN (AEX-3) domain